MGFDIVAYVEAKIAAETDESVKLAYMHALADLAVATAKKSGKLTKDPEKPVKPSKWAHVPLAALFAEDGNDVVDKGDKLTSSHVTSHTSQSGNCIVIWPIEGRYFCSSCNEKGDAADYIANRLGCERKAAEHWLAVRYGKVVMVRRKLAGTVVDGQ